jgi:hypothetical protein
VWSAADIGVLDDPFWAYLRTELASSVSISTVVHGDKVKTTFYFTGAQLSG